MRTSASLKIGDIYSRDRLTKKFKITDATVKNGIFRPKGHESVWLFVTEEKSTDRTGYIDLLQGDDLTMEGQTKHGTDALVKGHEAMDLELLLFYRKTKKEHQDFGFRYEGSFRYISERDQGPGRPTLFHLQRVTPELPPHGPIDLRLVKTVEEIRGSVERFAAGAAFAQARAVSLLHQSTYWVYDRRSAAFGPGKFVAFAGMDFSTYERARTSGVEKSRFDGNATQTAIARVLDAEFQGNEELGRALQRWAESRFGRDLFDGVDTNRWEFLTLPEVGSAEEAGGSNGPPPAGGNDLALAAHAAESAGAFDPSNEDDARNRVLQEIVRRRGQPKFRARLLRAYDGRCAITGCSADAALEAAHIQPYLGDHTNHVQNGLLLRADLHTLFDRGLIAIDTSTKPWKVVVAPAIGSTTYKEIAGRSLSLPSNAADQPDKKALNHHRKLWGL